jgi:hypothetical protein
MSPERGRMSRYRAIWPDVAADGPFEFWSLSDDDGVLTIRLRGSSTYVVLRFEAYLAYRKHDEGDAVRTLRAIERTSRLGEWFYMVEQSEFAEWFMVEAGGLRHGAPMLHYVIACSNDLIDVLSPEPPATAREPLEYHAG